MKISLTVFALIFVAMLFAAGIFAGKSWFTPKPVSDEPIATAEAEIVVRIDTVIVEKIVQLDDSTFQWEYEDEELAISGTIFGVAVRGLRVDSIRFQEKVEIRIYDDVVEATPPRTDRLTMHFNKLQTRKPQRERSLIRPVISGGMMLGISGYSFGVGLELEYIPFTRVPFGGIVLTEFQQIEKSTSFGIKIIVPLSK